MLISYRRRTRSSVHFVDHLEEPRYHRRPRSLIRHSSVEILESRTPHTSRLRRRRPLYYDGAADTQINGIYSDLDGAKEEEANAADCVETIAVPAKSPKPTTPDEPISLFTANHTHSPAELSRSTSRFSSNEGHHAQVKKQSPRFDGHSDKLHISSSGPKTSRLTDRVRVAFADPGYEVDSQIPSPPSVTYAAPILRPSRTLSPLYVYDIRSPGKTYSIGCGCCHTEPLSPAYSDAGDSSPVSCRKMSYERVRPNSEPLSPPDTDQDPGYPFTSYASATPGPTDVTSMVDNPDHPDHLAFLLSTAQLSQDPEQENFRKTHREEDERVNSATSFVSRSPDSEPCYYEHTKIGSLVSNLDGGSNVDDPSKGSFETPTPEKFADRRNRPVEYSDEDFYPHGRSLGRRNAMHDISDANESEDRYHETQVDYEAEGRAHMQALGKSSATQEQEKEAMYW